MAIPSIHSPSSSSVSSIDPTPMIPSSTLLVGELNIGGRSYTVSIESSKPLVSSPAESTREKIEYLVDLHLKHLESQGADLSKIVLQQIDEEGLSYVSSEGDNEMLPSSTLQFAPYNPFDEKSSFPLSLQSLPITTIKEIYTSIINSLTLKKSEENEVRTLTSRPKKFTKDPFSSETQNSDPCITFIENLENTLVKTLDSPNTRVISKGSSDEVSKPIEDMSNKETTNSDGSESIGRWTRVWKSAMEWMPNFSFWKSGSYDLIDPSKIVEEERESFLQNNPQVQESLKRFEDINLQ